MPRMFMEPSGDREGVGPALIELIAAETTRRRANRPLRLLQEFWCAQVVIEAVSETLGVLSRAKPPGFRMFDELGKGAVIECDRGDTSLLGFDDDDG